MSNEKSKNGLMQKIKKAAFGGDCCCCNLKIVPEKPDEEKGKSE